MPFISILNSTPYTLHIGLSSVIPIKFENYVTPGATFHTEFGSALPFSVEVRSVRGAEFSEDESLAQLGILAGTLIAGAASLFLGASDTSDALNGRRPSTNRILTSQALTIAATAGYQAYNRDADGVVLRARQQPLGSTSKHFIIEFTDDGRYQLLSQEMDCLVM